MLERPPATPAPARLGRPARSRAMLAVLAAAIVGAYANTFGVPFVLDDFFNVIDNESVHGFGAWWQALAPRAQVYTAGRPLLNLSFAVNYALGGFSVAGYHAFNLLVHLAAALTLFALVRRTAERWPGASPGREGNLAPAPRASIEPGRFAFVAALLWALHPLQTNCVTYISQRAESMMALCYLLTLLCFLRAVETRRRRWSIAAVSCCAAGVLTKEVMVTAPIVVFLYDRTFVAGSFRAAWRERKALHLALAATWLLLAALMFGTSVSERGVGFGFRITWLDYLQIAATTVLHYARLAVWPWPLVFDYGLDIAPPHPLRFALATSILLGLLAGIVRGLRRGSAWAFLGACFLLVLAPTTSLVPVAGQPIAENRMYLPLAALAVAAAGILRAGGRKTMFAAMAAALALGLLTSARNRDYRSEIALWADTVAKRPASSRAHLNYGTALMRVQRHAEGVRAMEAAVRLSPDYVLAHAHLASGYVVEKRYEDAIRHFQIALAADPDDPMTRSNYGAALFHVGRWQDSLQQFLAALRLRPTHLPSRGNAAILLARLGRPAEAIALFEETLRMYPQHTPAREQLAHLKAAIASGAYKPSSGTP